MAKCTGVRCPMQYGYKVEECNQTDCPYRTKPITNADRIRAMSDEELVKFLEDAESGIEIPYCQSKEECLRDLPDIPDGGCSKCLLEWLNQPAEG